MMRCQDVALVAGLLCFSEAWAQESPPLVQMEAPTPLLVFHDRSGATEQAQTLRARLDDLMRQRAGAMLDLTPKPLDSSGFEVSIDRGRQAFHQFEFEASLRHLQDALDEASRTGGGALQPTQLTELHLLRALALTQHGDRTAAWDEFLAAARLDPTRVLDAASHPPSVLQVFERARASVTQARRGVFHVVATPDCQIKIDGYPLVGGQGRELVLGTHYVAIRCPGFLPHGARVLVHRDGQQWQPVLRPDQPPDDRQVAQLARGRGAAVVLVVQVLASGGAPPSALARLLDGDTGAERARLSTGLMDRTETQRAADAILKLLQHGDLASAPEEASQPPEAPSYRWYRRPWFWASLGALTVAFALSPFLIDRSAPTGFVVRPRSDLSIDVVSW